MSACWRASLRTSSRTSSVSMTSRTCSRPGLAIAGREFLLQGSDSTPGGKRSLLSERPRGIAGLVIMIGPNHTGRSTARSGVSLWDAGAFRTPLGDVPVDADAGEALREISGGAVEIDHDAHEHEHAIEVELPFLQLRRADVRIAPLILAWDAWPAARGLADVLARFVHVAGEPVLLLASSDLNHYEPAVISEQKD